MELSRDFYVGIVEDNKDPNRKGRIKVRIQTLYHTIPVEDIPYAYPIASLAGKEFQIPAIGKLVNVVFLSDDLYSPYYMYSENYNENLQRKLKSLTDEEYVDFTALLFDQSTQIYVKGQTFTLDQLLNKITIDNPTINLELKDNEGILNLGSRDADQDAILGTRFFQWMDEFIAELMKPYSLMGNSGAPIIKTKLNMLCQKYQQLRPDFVSNNVKIVDNGEVKILQRTPETINNKNDIDLIIPIEEYPVINQKLNNAILDQNNRACEGLKDAAPTTRIPLSTNPNADENDASTKVWQKASQNIIDSLHPEMRPYVTRFINRCQAEAGIKLTLTSGYRSIDKQKQLIKQGRPAAQPGKSYHNYGLAIDVKPTNSNDWYTIGQIGQSIGFRWGKHFRSPQSEPWHFDMGFDNSTSELLKRYNAGDLRDDGYVNIGIASIAPTQNQFNGQDYQVKNDQNTQQSVSQPCDAGGFNNGAGNPDNGKSDENEEANVKIRESNLTCQEKNATILLERIAIGEGTTDKIANAKGFDSAYDVTYAYGKYTPTYVPGTNKKVNPITSLTIGEVKKVQAAMYANQTDPITGKSKSGIRSNPMGKYQIVNMKNSPTMSLIQKQLDLSDETLFSADTQDRMGIQLLKNRGLDKWLSGQKSDDEFQKGLAYEWASVAKPNGKSEYGQHVGTSSNQIQEAMSQTKSTQCS